MYSNQVFSEVGVMRKVCLLTTGGTIASRLEPESGHVTASLTGAEL